MPRRRRKSNIGLIVLVLLIVIGAIAFTTGKFKFEVVGLRPFLGNYGVISLSQARFESSSKWFGSEPVWILTVVQGIDGQHVTGVITNDEITSMSGKEANRDFTITLDHGNQKCEWRIQPDYTKRKVMKLNRHEWFCYFPPTEEDARQHCSGENILYAKYDGIFATCFCIEEVTSHEVGKFDSPEIHTTTTITVSNGEDPPDTGKINTETSPSAFIGDNVHAEFMYYGGTPDSCPSVMDYLPFYGTDGSWHVGSRSYYEQYWNWRDALQAKIGEKVTKQEIDNMYNTINYLAGLFLTPLDNEIGYIKSGKVIKTLDGFFERPVYRMYVKADYLIIHQPVGIPKIVDIDAPDFGTYGQVTVSVKNDGDSEWFTTWIECPTFKGDSKELSVESGKIVDFVLGISANVDKPTTETCTAYVKGFENSDSKQFTITANPSQVCTPNMWKCGSDGNVYRCNQYGSKLELIEECDPDTEICDYRATGEAYCKKKQSDCAQDGERPTPTRPCCEGLKVVNGVCSSSTEPDWLKWIKENLEIIMIIFLVIVLIIFIILAATGRLRRRPRYSQSYY